MRRRLHDRLDDRLIRLHALVAPSGFGKTTLVRTWTASFDPGKQKVVWVSLSENLASADTLWDAVLAAARRFRIVDDITEARSAMAAGLDPVGIISDVLSRPVEPVVLVIDAYEHANSIIEQIDGALVSLVTRDPLLHVVVTSRGGTRLTDAPLRLAAGVEVIDRADLAFTLEETASLLDEGHEESDWDTEAVHDQTGGYPLALRAVLLGMRSPAGDADSHSWRAMVAEGLLGQFDPQIRRFAIDTSVPPFFDRELAATLFPSSEIDQFLSEFERLGIGRWVPFAPNRPVFQYADVAREAFLARLFAEKSDRQKTLARRSARWLFDNGLLEEALEHAIEGIDYDLATGVYQAIMLARPETYMNNNIDRYLSRVPRPLLNRYPVLAFARALCAVTNPATRAAAPGYIAIAASNLANHADDLDPVDAAMRHVYRAVALRMGRQFTESGRAAHHALASLDRGGVEDRDDWVEMRPTALRHLAYSLYQAGETDAASALVDRALTTATTPWSRNYTASYNIGMHAFAGRLPAARSAAAMVDPEAWPPGHDRGFMNVLGRVGAATILLDSFDFAGAADQWEDCDAFVPLSEFWPLVTWTLMHARLGLGQASAEAHRIQAELDATLPPPGFGPSLASDAVRGALAVLWLAAGRRAAARDLLTGPAEFPGQLAPGIALDLHLAGDGEALLNLLPRLERGEGSTLRTRTATATIAASTALRGGKTDIAKALLQDATALYEQSGARLHLTYLPADEVDELRNLADGMPDIASSTYLLSPVPSIMTSGDYTSGTGTAPVLTNQEMLVLAAIADLRASGQRPTRGQLGAHLHLSENTIKSHLRNLYRKLGADSRESVVQRAMALHLLQPRAKHR